MSAILIRGIGAVSPAGWGVPALRDALEKEIALPTQPIVRPGWTQPLLNRPVPPCTTRPACLSYPRLRRTGALTHHVVASAFEAMGEDAAKIQAGKIRIGIIVCLMAGNVAYSRRFYEETLRDPASASPMIFPETVFNAPASHLAACLNSTQATHTIVGDDGTFLQGVALGADWIANGQVDSAVVIGAEEMDWIVADALRLFHPQTIHGAGAGALYLTATPGEPTLAKLNCVTDSFLFTADQSRADAARNMRAQLPSCVLREVLCPSTQGISKLDAPEHHAWLDWQGPRRLTRTVLGQAFAASAAWQCVAACDAIQCAAFSAANVSVLGVNQQAIGARFARTAF
ncbi:MAG TPA: hypothetical protein VH413_08740 [Verrucomicrobiae bacterium]|jgi:hypothetical protein|nr:hypothetical protein [Verrucomicrobiae bacterium]